MKDINDIRTSQKKFFDSGRTKSVSFRIHQLERLYKTIEKYEDKLLDALKNDLNKPELEAYETEIGQIKGEIRYLKNHLAGWSRPKIVPGSLVTFPSVNYIYQEPYGVVLVMAPWNYPVLLSLEPLAGAIAAGNCVMLKPSGDAPCVSTVLKVMLKEIFPDVYVSVIEGGRKENQELLKCPFDYMFFTGSTGVGKLVMEAASKHLTPVSLELGGKSPCIVDETADIVMAAKKITWGKFLNAGQTCVAPDYLLVHDSIKEELVSKIIGNMEKMYKCREDFPSIVNEKHFDRLLGLMKSGKILKGGDRDREKLFIEPTLLGDVTWESPIMSEEIFGPILPIMTYHNFKEALSFLGQKPKPLACYYFTRSKEREAYLLKHYSFGGGCMNDTILHLTGSRLPFGGVGESGMGVYHGKYSFHTFSHSKSILKKPSFGDNPLRYPPYTKRDLWLIRRIMK